MTDPIDQQSPPPATELESRNLLRSSVLEVAARLDTADLSAVAAASALREAAQRDARDLDADDIEVDFDASLPETPEFSAAPLIGSPKPKVDSTDPLDAALLRAIKLRDRNSVLRIVGDTPGADDHAAYLRALATLRDRLNDRLDTE